MVTPALAASNPLVRKTKYGSVEGKAVTGIETTNKAWAWLGIPYAKPPVGELRWKAPRDPEPWSGIKPTQTLPGRSAQMGGFILDLEYETFNKPLGSEDSLYLNVWTPRKTGGKRPVVFWIHGGGVTPLAKGLFHRAMAQSGSPSSTARKDAEDASNATIYRLLIKDGYASSDEEAAQFMADKSNAWVASYLRSKPAEEFLQPTIFNADFMNPKNMISITEDGYVFSKSLSYSINSGNYAKVPTILSSCKEEFKFFLPLSGPPKY